MNRLTLNDVKQLEKICPGGISLDVNLATLSRWRIGGRASALIRPASSTELAAVRRFFDSRKLSHVVIGLTTNLLFSDEGLHVPCIQIGSRMSSLRLNGNRIYAQAGVWVPGLARYLMKLGLTGGEHICGIPGTLGGLICMNGGSQRKGIGNNIVSVESIDQFGATHERSFEECAFSYRQSVFQRNDEIISSAYMHFPPGSRSEIRREMRSILEDRRRKFPRKEPNCGSVFKSNPIMYTEIGPPGAAIEKLGFKGMSIGGAMVSPRHANFIVNTGGARAVDVLTLIRRIASSVESSTGYRMEAEACYVTPEGAVYPADQYVG